MLRPHGFPRKRLGALLLVLSVARSVMAQGSETIVSDELSARARALGQVRVIVTFRVSDTAPVSGVDAIKREVLAAIAPTPQHVVRQLARLPQLVLDASEDTLRVLAALPCVLRVDESRPSRPQR